MAVIPDQSMRGRHRSSRRGVYARTWPTVLLAIVAATLLLYPVAASQINNYHQLQAAREFSGQVYAGDDFYNQEQLQRAHAYNASRSQGPILDPWLSRDSVENSEFQEYLKHLDGHEVMARLVVPAAQVDLPVYHGTSAAVLNKGVGHLYGSDLPVGGEGTHSVLTAHTGLTNATLFDHLTDVAIGDEIYISVAGTRLKYQVTEINVVLPNETDTLYPESSKDKLTLITCTPYGINSHRLLVTGERVELTDEESEQVFHQSSLSWAWWMLAFIAGALLILGATVWWVLRVRRSIPTSLRSTALTSEDHS